MARDIKIKMKTPLVEMNGDEMARVLWEEIREVLITPFVDLRSVNFDLSVLERDRTEGRVSADAVTALLTYGVGVKCPTITPTPERVREYGLVHDVPSPNRLIRKALGGILFRTPISLPAIKPLIPNWKKSITVIRYAYGDVYRGVEIPAEKGDVCELVLRKAGGEMISRQVYDFSGSGVVQAMHNVDDGIAGFAHCCMRHALDTGQDLWFGAKDTVSKTYDRRFFDIFDRVYKEGFEEGFNAGGIAYHSMLVDDAVARAIRSEGGFVWACKNYDGDVFSDMVAAGFGSLAMMSSYIISPDGQACYEAAHGTVKRHYYRYTKGEQVSTNPVGLIFAWSGALRKRGEKDGLTDLTSFAEKLEGAVAGTIADGIVTADILPGSIAGEGRAVDFKEFISETASRLRRELFADEAAML